VVGVTGRPHFTPQERNPVSIGKEAGWASELVWTQNLTTNLITYLQTKFLYKTINLPVVLCEHETWFLALREEQRLKVFENRVLMSIFRPRKDEVTGGLRKQLNEKLYNLYSSPNIITMIKQRMR
jgi:hypothetical protein